MNGNLILASARKAVLARLSALGRRFCSDDVEEMVSMTVERFYTRGSYDPSRSSVQTYVSHIASSAVYDFVTSYDKSRGRFSSLEAMRYDDSAASEASDTRDIRLADSREADSALLERERESAFQLARARLSPRYQECYDLLAEGRSHAEIALLTDTTVGNVGVTAYRMRQQLKALLDDVA